jgi:AbrB family looped-hinge helix DNA binding protein
MKITSKGQVTIPLEIRQKLGLLPNTEVEFKVQGNTARLVKVSAKLGHGRGSELVTRLRGKADVRMTTNEILALTRKRA